MDAHLMGPPRPGLALDPAQAIAATQQTPAGNRALACRIGDHLPSFLPVQLSQGLVCDAGIGFGRAMDHGPVGLLDMAGSEQGMEPPERAASSRQDETAARVAIEAMGEGRSHSRIEPQGIERRFQRGSAGRARMHREARGLVENNDVPVEEEQAVPQLLPQ
jgi:hypothetical protein